MIDTSNFFDDKEKEFILNDKKEDNSLEIMIVLFTISAILNIFFAFITFV